MNSCAAFKGSITSLSTGDKLFFRFELELTQQYLNLAGVMKLEKIPSFRGKFGHSVKIKIAILPETEGQTSPPGRKGGGQLARHWLLLHH